MSLSIRRLCVAASIFGVSIFSGSPGFTFGQTFTNISSLNATQESIFERAPSKVINILPISHFRLRQDLVTNQDVQSPPSGELLPGLERSQELVIPQDSDPETLPDSREIIANPGAKYGVAWVGLNNRAKPKADADVNPGQRVGQDRLPAASLSRVFRRPSPPPPVISPFQPAFVHIPVQIQVVPMYVEHYHYWPGVPATPSHYFGSPSVAPGLLPVPGSYGSPVSSPPLPRAEDFGINRRVHAPTDQSMHYIQEVNLIGSVSNSVNFVSYPFNHHSYPLHPTYGVHVQTFPVNRRLP